MITFVEPVSAKAQCIGSGLKSSLLQMNIAVTQHNIEFGKNKGYMFRLKMISQLQAQLQECKRGCILQLYFKNFTFIGPCIVILFL